MEVRSSTPPRKKKIEDLYELTRPGLHYISQNLEECSFVSHGRNITFPTESDQRRTGSSSGMTFEKLIVGCKYRILSTIPEPFVSLISNDDDKEWKYKYDSGNYLFLIKHPPPPSYFYNELFNLALAFRRHKSEKMRDEIAGGILILPRNAVDLGYIILSRTAGLKNKSEKKKKSKKKKTKRKKKRKSKQRRKKSKMR
jgi:hypothetical protein